MMTTRILIYGGTNLPPELVRFVHRLTRALLRFPDVVLLSGGFKCYKQYPRRTSVDAAVLAEAEKWLEPDELTARFETWLPREGLDRRSVQRFTDKGTVHVVEGTAQARRFAMVTAADAVITIRGEGQTRTVLEFALALAKPALPIRYSGGDSRTLWKRHKDDLLQPFRLSPQLVDLMERKTLSISQLDRLASSVAKVAHNSAQKQCLVLMPFGRGHNRFYVKFLRPAIARAGYIPHRIDRDEWSGNIESLFFAAVERARAIVMDVTGANPNVMYELGYVHAQRAGPLLLLIRRPPTRKTYDKLPFYLQHQRLVSASDNDAGWGHLGQEVERYLKAVERHGSRRRSRVRAA